MQSCPAHLVTSLVLCVILKTADQMCARVHGPGVMRATEANPRMAPKDPSCPSHAVVQSRALCDTAGGICSCSYSSQSAGFVLTPRGLLQGTLYIRVWRSVASPGPEESCIRGGGRGQSPGGLLLPGTEFHHRPERPWRVSACEALGAAPGARCWAPSQPLPAGSRTCAVRLVTCVVTRDTESECGPNTLLSQYITNGQVQFLVCKPA